MHGSWVSVGSIVQQRVAVEGFGIDRVVVHVVGGIVETGVCTHFQPWLDLRVSVDTAIILLLVAVSEDAVVATIVERDVDIAFLHAIREADGMVLLNTCSEHLVNPVVALSVLIGLHLVGTKGQVGTQQGVVDVCLTVCRGMVEHIAVGEGIDAEVAQLLSVHRLGKMALRRGADKSGIAHLALAKLCFLGSNHHNTVCAPDAIDSGGTGIFEHLDILHIVGVDAAESTERVVHHLSIDHIDRVRAGIDGVHTTNLDGTVIGRIGVGDDRDARHTALDGFVDIGNRALLQRLGIHHRHRTRQITLAHDGSDDDDLVEGGILFLQLNFEIPVSYFHFLGCETNIGNGKFGIGIGLHRKITVNVGNGALGSACYSDTGANDRFCSLVDHITFDCDQLRHRMERCANDNKE